jgi:hypothetical protein
MYVAVAVLTSAAFATSASSNEGARGQSNRGMLFGTAQVGAVLPEAGGSATEKNGLSGGVAFDYFVSRAQTIGVCAGYETFNGGQDDYERVDETTLASVGLRVTHHFGSAGSSSPYLILGGAFYQFRPDYAVAGDGAVFTKAGPFAGIGWPIPLSRTAGLGLEVESHHPTFGESGGSGWYLRTHAVLRFRIAGGL